MRERQETAGQNKTLGQKKILVRFDPNKLTQVSFESHSLNDSSRE